MKIILFVLLGLNLFGVVGQDDNLIKGNELIFSQEFKEAEKYYKKTIKNYPDNLLYKNELAQTLILQEKYIEAELVFDAVLKIDQNNEIAIWRYAVCEFQMKNYCKAAHLFRKYINLKTGNENLISATSAFIHVCENNCESC